MNSIIKKAFIDAECDGLLLAEHKFSVSFEKSMDKLLKYQKGFFKLVNTVGKRAACIIIALIIFVTTTFFSVDAIRKPITEAIEKFYVAVRQKLTNTQADNIAVHFTDDITEIVATNLITVTNKVYVIDNPQKIKEFVELLTQTNWGEPLDGWGDDTEYVQYRYEFKSGEKTVTTLNICSNIDGWFGIAEIVSDGNSTVYNISERTFYDILAFTTQKYYLHQSDLKLPDKTKCTAWQNEALKGLDDESKERLSKNYRRLHSAVEDFLLGNVASLKEPDSIYWEPLLNPKETTVLDDGTQIKNSAYYRILKIFDEVIPDINHKNTKNAVKMMREDFIEAVNNHDLGAVFAVHEYIHDYDYYVINYPVQYSMTPPDWGGIDEYFGRIE